MLALPPRSPEGRVTTDVSALSSLLWLMKMALIEGILLLLAGAESAAAIISRQAIATGYLSCVDHPPRAA